MVETKKYAQDFDGNPLADMELDCESGAWIKSGSESCVQERPLVLAALQLRVLLSESYCHTVFHSSFLSENVKTEA
jgi:hypothetical protein